MIGRFSRLGAALSTLVIGAAAAASCGGGSSTGDTTSSHSGGGHGGGSGGQGTGNGGSGGGLFTTGGSGGALQQGFDVQPSAMQTITVPIGAQAPTVTFTATLDGLPIKAGWSVDRGDLGSITTGASETGVFTPKGTTGGVVNVVAGLNNQTLKRPILVKLAGEQNGPNPNSPEEQVQIAGAPADLVAGGGIGGVGGEGLGVAIGDAITLGALGAPTSDGTAQGLRFIYPYDKTVWPRGLLAPLLQWESSLGDADGIQIELSTTTGSFTWKGTFGRPAILAQTGGKFIRHPIPQDIWAAATNSAAGLSDQLTLKLTVALGGQAYGPITQTWTVAPARLSGTIYYNSYGTNLAKNYKGAVGGDGMFGGAVLSIRAGDTGPKLTAGGNSAGNYTDETQCRTCHSVAANGARLVVQQGQNYGLSSSYDLSPSGASETAMPGASTWFPGVSPDGSLALFSNGQLRSLPGGAAVPTTGLPAGALGMPAFSPDGKRVAFNPGMSNQLMVMSFDPATNTFANPVTVFDGGAMPGWPAFFPDGNSVVFERETAVGGDGHGASILWTRAGAKGHIAWTSAADAQSVAALNQLNGLDGNGNSYLPTLAAPVGVSCEWTTGQVVSNIDPTHADDQNLNYEPTVSPVASGGYAWVVFTSRRMYGSVATIPPFCSDPRWAALFDYITPKKLWVAAVDINGQVGTDPSHPAFYLPGQEILAGNSRGFWTLDPCRPDGQGCESGDQCCNGYCQPNGPNGELTCSDKPPGNTCSAPQEKCTTAADCCDTTNLCINGFCTVKGPS